MIRPPSEEILQRMFSLPQETHPERIYVLNQLQIYNISIPKSFICDLGCGSHKTINSAWGVDIRPTSNICGTIERLPFRNDSVDVIISRHSFEHVLDSVEVLLEWRRCLKPGGLVIFVLPDFEFLDTMHPILSSNVHLHAFTRKSFFNLVNRIENFNIEKLETVVEEWSFGGAIRRIK